MKNITSLPGTPFEPGLQSEFQDSQCYTEKLHHDNNLTEKENFEIISILFCWFGLV